MWSNTICAFDYYYNTENNSRNIENTSFRQICVTSSVNLPTRSILSCYYVIYDVRILMALVVVCQTAIFGVFALQKSNKDLGKKDVCFERYSIWYVLNFQHIPLLLFSLFVISYLKCYIWFYNVLTFSIIDIFP